MDQNDDDCYPVHRDVIADHHNPRLARQLARVVGLFGPRGWPECEIELADGKRATYPLPKEAAEVVQYVRKILKEYHVEPIAHKK